MLEDQKRQEDKKKEGLRRIYLEDLGKRAEEVKVVKNEQQKQTALIEKQKREEEEKDKKKKIVQNQPKVMQRQSI